MKLLFKEFGTKKMEWEILQPVPSKDVQLQVNLKNALRDASVSGEHRALLFVVDYKVTGIGPNDREKPEPAEDIGRPIYFRITGECGAVFAIDDVTDESFKGFAKDSDTMNWLMLHVQPLFSELINDALRRMGIHSVRSQPWLQGADFEWTPTEIALAPARGS